jgi:hypothetical protein
MIRWNIRRTDQAVNGGEIDDAASARLPKVGDYMLGAKENAFHIDGLDSVQ